MVVMQAVRITVEGHGQQNVLLISDEQNILLSMSLNSNSYTA